MCVLIKLTKFIKIPDQGQTTGLKTFSVLKMIFSVVKITNYGVPTDEAWAENIFSTENDIFSSENN